MFARWPRVQKIVALDDILRSLKNSSLALKPPDVSNNLCDVIGSHSIDLRHVPELPMVGFDPLGRSPLKSKIRMVTGLIDLVHQRRSLRRPCALRSVARRTKGIKFFFTLFEFCRKVFHNRYLCYGRGSRGFSGIRPILRTSHNHTPTKKTCNTSE